MKLGQLINEPIKIYKRQPIVDWVESNIVLSSRFAASPGKIDVRNITPYLVEILETLEDPKIKTITLLFASQLAKTTCIESMHLYQVANDPGPSIWAFPETKARDAYVSNRLQSLIESSPAIRTLLSNKKKAITRVGIDYKTMPLYFALADSESDLASKPAQYIIGDEIDKFPRSTSNEGSPLDQLRARQRTFPRTKFIQSSTPTTYAGPIWQQYQASDKRIWEVPCPNCNEYHEWNWNHINWKKPDLINRDEFARGILDGTYDIWWECPTCRHRVSERSTKDDMNMSGRWTAKGVSFDHAGFQLNALASPFVDIRELAAEYQLAIYQEEWGDSSKRKHFQIHQLAQPYKEKDRIIAEENITERIVRDYNKGEVPEFVDFITAGIDVQHDRIYYSIIGWKQESQRAHIIDWGEIEGDFQALSKAEIWTRVVAKEFEWEGRKSTPLVVCIDANDQTELIKGWANSYPHKGLIPIQSKPIAAGHYFSRPNKNQNDKTRYLSVDKIKSFWSSLMSRPLEHSGRVSYPIEAEEDSAFQRQLCSEEKTKKGNWIVRKGYQDNHFWDTVIYATGAAIIKGLLREQLTVATPTKKKIKVRIK